MQVYIRVEEDVDGAALISWLRDDPVSRWITFEMAAGSPEEMGAGEVIEAVISNTIALSSLIVAISAWRDARRSRKRAAPQVNLERNNIVLAVTGSDSSEIDRIVEILMAAGAEDEDSE